MEKIRITNETIEHIEHDFYCNECNKFLGTSRELHDGYYPKLGHYERQFYLNGWYKIDTTLCEECSEKKTNQIVQALIELGFKKENY